MDKIALAAGIPVEMARAGTFRALRGGKVTLTDSMLAEIVANTRGPVPLKLGHEEVRTDSPSLGYVRNVRIENGVLVADPDANDYGKELNRKGAFRCCSPELERTASGWKMTALGLLGAWPPADTGKRAVALAEPRAGDRVVLLAREPARASPAGTAVSEESIRTAMRGFRAMNPDASDAEAREAVHLALETDSRLARQVSRLDLAESRRSISMTQRCRDLIAEHPGMTFAEAARRVAAASSAMRHP